MNVRSNGVDASANLIVMLHFGFVADAEGDPKSIVRVKDCARSVHGPPELFRRSTLSG